MLLESLNIPLITSKVTENHMEEEAGKPVRPANNLALKYILHMQRRRNNLHHNKGEKK